MIKFVFNNISSLKAGICEAERDVELAKADSRCNREVV